MLKLNLGDYIDAYIPVEGNIAVVGVRADGAARVVDINNK